MLVLIKSNDRWKTWDINIKGTYLCSKYFIPLLLKGQLKTNILTSSYGAVVHWQGASGYQTTKLAVSLTFYKQARLVSLVLIFARFAGSPSSSTASTVSRVWFVLPSTLAAS